MKARPEDLRPPCFLSTKSRPQPPTQGRVPTAHVLAAPKTHVLEGFFPLSPDRRRKVLQNERLIRGRRPAVTVPCLPLPATPPPSTLNPTPPHRNSPHLKSGRLESNFLSVPAPASCPHPGPEERGESQEAEEAPQVATATITEPDHGSHLGPAASPASLSQGSLSDLSRPPSSLFSRSTDLTGGRSSVLSREVSADDSDSDSEGGGRFSPPPLSPVEHLPPVSSPPAGPSPRPSSESPTATPPLHEPLTLRPASGLHRNSDDPLSRTRSTEAVENHSQDAPVDPELNPPLDSDHGLAAVAFPSATWSSCPSPQRSTPRSGSGAALTPSPPVSRLESGRWPVLPPISPVRGRCGSPASRCSELSCSRSAAFDELEAVAPRSTSCSSLDRVADSSGRPSPDRELSSGLAALTVACDSGNLGSLSRVQLLLLGRPEPETPPSPCGQEGEFSSVQDWISMCNAEGALRPRTAGGISERCDSAGEVRENKSDRSGSGSPSSWIIDPSPSSPDMFRSSHSCSTDEGPTEEESHYPGQVESSDGENEEKKRRMEERKSKVLNMLCRLQDVTPRQSKSDKGRSDFEDFDFLAKYCIFSQEKLDQYKRAFEAEDGDGDGYISCLQVLLALKNIIPPELLSDEEEIYVYRILEMVDFRVTDGLVDLRLFAVIASLAQKIATMDEFMRSLISSMDFRSLEVRLFKAKQLFLFLLEEQRGDAGARQGFISAEQLLLELKAGGVHLEQEAAVRLELQHIPPLDLLDFLAYLPLFMLIHKSVISNPLNDVSSDL